MSDEVIHPVKMSMSGKNAYYHHCNHRGQAVSYAVCLHTLSAIDESRINEGQFTDCQAACTRWNPFHIAVAAPDIRTLK